jgi:hypothetical protein
MVMVPVLNVKHVFNPKSGSHPWWNWLKVPMSKENKESLPTTKMSKLSPFVRLPLIAPRWKVPESKVFALWANAAAGTARAKIANDNTRLILIPPVGFLPP